MIKSFKHKGLEQFFIYDNRRLITPRLLNRITRLLDRLDASEHVADMNLPGFEMHPLKGIRKGFWSVKVFGNWRITFRFEGTHAFDVNLEDYH